MSQESENEVSPELQQKHDERCQRIANALQLDHTTLEDAIMSLVSVLGRVCAMAPNPEAVCLVVVSDIVEEFAAERRRLAAERNVTIPAPPEEG